MTHGKQCVMQIWWDENFSRHLVLEPATKEIITDHPDRGFVSRTVIPGEFEQDEGGNPKIRAFLDPAGEPAIITQSLLSTIAARGPTILKALEREYGWRHDGPTEFEGMSFSTMLVLAKGNPGVKFTRGKVGTFEEVVVWCDFIGHEPKLVVHAISQKLSATDYFKTDWKILNDNVQKGDDK